jgi:hypothetical protein
MHITGVLYIGHYYHYILIRSQIHYYRNLSLIQHVVLQCCYVYIQTLPLADIF